MLLGHGFASSMPVCGTGVGEVGRTATCRWHFASARCCPLHQQLKGEGAPVSLSSKQFVPQLLSLGRLERGARPLRGLPAFLTRASSARPAAFRLVTLFSVVAVHLPQGSARLRSQLLQRLVAPSGRFGKAHVGCHNQALAIIGQITPGPTPGPANLPSGMVARSADRGPDRGRTGARPAEAPPASAPFHY